MTLDDFLGPRDTDPVDPIEEAEQLVEWMSHGTRWNCEERLLSTLRSFEDAMDHQPNTERLRKSWIAGARDFVNECGERPDWMIPLVSEMRKRGLSVGTPRSLISLALEWIRQGGNQDDRGRYLRGKLAGDDEQDVADRAEDEAAEEAWNHE